MEKPEPHRRTALVLNKGAELSLMFIRYSQKSVFMNGEARALMWLKTLACRKRVIFQGEEGAPREFLAVRSLISYSLVSNSVQG